MEAYTTNAILGGMTMAMELEVAINAVENGAEKTALLNHSRDQNCSKCRNRCRTGTGDRSEEAGYDNTYNGDTALFMSYAGIYEVDQSFGNTGFCHNVSGQNKERDSKKQEFTDSGVHICSYDRQRCTGIKDGTYR